MIVLNEEKLVFASFFLKRSSVILSVDSKKGMNT